MPESSIRKYRCDDDTYVAATARAAAEGTDVSKLIRQWLGDYAANRTEAADPLAYRPQPAPVELLDQVDGLVAQLRGQLAGR